MAILYITLATLAATYLYASWRTANARPRPPGPKPLPLIGNILDLTAHQLWLRVTEWSKAYGPVVYIHVFGQGLVFLNTHEAASDLLDKKGSIYSDKPALVMAGELCGCENMVAFTRYGDFSRRQRKLMNSALGINAVKAYRPLLQIESLVLLKNILRDPGNYLSYVRKYAGGLTLQSVYGHRASGPDDPLITLAEECVDILSNRIASGGGIWPVDIFPFLKRLPMWFPGAGFKRKAVAWKAKMEEFVDRPYEMVKERMRNGTAVPCFVTTLLEEEVAHSSSISEKESSELEGKEEGRGKTAFDPKHEFDIRWTANSMYSASIDTTLTVVQHFLLALLTQPSVLRTAQAEMDRVLGSRLPTFEDRGQLPYLECVMSEVLRWGVPVPLGLPHRLMEDDVYEGMCIPKGSLVFANIWNMLRDPELYPDPDTFRPERFSSPPPSLSPSSTTADANADAEKKRTDPRQFVFGFGRRKCPGAHLVEESLWMVMALFVAVLDVSAHAPSSSSVRFKEKEKSFEEVSFDNAVFRTPSPFRCDIRPRNALAVRVVMEAAEALGV